MKLQKFKEKNNKQKNIIIFTIACVLLVTSVFLYKTFSSFQVIENQNFINGSIEDPGDIYFAFYKDNKIQKDMPKKSDGYVLDEEKSYCGVTGGNDSNIKVSITEDETIQVHGVTTSRTKCNLYFVKGAYILGKGITLASEGEDGLYEVKHEDITNINEGFKTTEYRYAGSNPNNYIRFNDEDWRIIGLVNVLVPQADGTEKMEQRVKIIRKESMGQIAWNQTQSNDWTNASLKALLNEGDYYKRANNYSTTGLQGKAQEMIEPVTWNLGAGMGNNSANTFMIYQYERGIHPGYICSGSGETFKCSEQLIDRNKFLWHGNVALMYPSDYGYAVGGTIRNDCLNKSLNYDNAQCVNSNWLREKAQLEWLLTPSVLVDGGAYVYEINIEGKVVQAHWGVTTASFYFRPTLYLKNDIKIIDGSGTSDDVFKIYQLD